jgi:N-acyl-D-aspartate/D-glutamate deacylase
VTAEIAIRGGTVVDGTGGKRRRADVGIANGRIVAIDTEVQGKREVDATGRIVAPGFIDIHTHYDPQVLWDPALSPSSSHGVTSVVAGNCGYSLAPTRPEHRSSLFRTLDKVEDMRVQTLEAGVVWDFETYPEYLDAVGRRGTALNFGGFIGHTALRSYVMGEEAFDRDATEAELQYMCALVADAIDAGALGFSTDRAGNHLGDGGRPVPSIVASQEEVDTLLAVRGKRREGIGHVAPGDNCGWVYELQPRLGRTITWTSILSFRERDGQEHPFRRKLAIHRQAWANGVRAVHPQVTCRPITSEFSAMEPTPLYRVPAFAEIAGAPVEGRAAVWNDERWRKRAWEELSSGRHVDIRLDNFAIADSPTRPEWIDRKVTAIAAELGKPVFEVACDLAVADQLDTRYRVTFANDDVDVVSDLLTTDGCVIGLSDAGAHVSQMCDAVLPTDFLANWVRDREVMTLERGIHKLSGELAAMLGSDRGRLVPGAPADVVVLDFDVLDPGRARRVHDLPGGGERVLADQPVGVDHVLVNGVPIRTDGQSMVDSLDTLPGQRFIGR